MSIWTCDISKDDFIVTKCELFDGECTVNGGFVITIDQACKDESYSQLPADNMGLFAHSTPSLNMDSIKDVIGVLDDTCKFNGFWFNFSIKTYSNNVVNQVGKVKIEFGFEQCGTLESRTTEDDTILTTYIHHERILDDTVISLMTEIKVQCVLRCVKTSENKFILLFVNYNYYDL